jgi:hypothetical protein
VTKYDFSKRQGYITIWDLHTRKELQTIQDETGRRIRDAVFLPDGRTLVAWGLDQTVTLWNVATGVSLSTHPAGGSGNVQATPDGRTLAYSVVSKDTQPSYGIELLETASGRRRALLTDLPEGIGAVPTPGFWAPGRFSPDGRLLPVAAGSWKFPTRSVLWDLAAGKMVRKLEPSFPGVTAFSPDGRILAVAGGGPGKKPSEHELVTLYDVRTGTALASFQGIANGESYLAYAPDGRFLVTASNACPGLRLWDASSGELLHEWTWSAEGTGTAGGVGLLALSPDGKTLVSGHHDGSLLFRDLDAVPALKKAKARNLPDDKPPASADEKTLSAEQLNKLWTDLAAKDAEKAYRAMWDLALHPKSSLPLLRERLTAPVPPTAEEVAKLLADLDHKDFDTREKSKQELAKVVFLVAADLRQTLKTTKSAQVRRSLEDILPGAELPFTDRATLCRLRAIEALEHIGTDEAQTILRRMGQGPAAAPETESAKLTLDRLAAREKWQEKRGFAVAVKCWDVARLLAKPADK